jgi:hypothetical protein
MKWLYDNSLSQKLYPVPFGDSLPKAQVQAFQLPVHISYFLQNCKKANPDKEFAPLKNDITTN